MPEKSGIVAAPWLRSCANAAEASTAATAAAMIHGRVTELFPSKRRLESLGASEFDRNGGGDQSVFTRAPSIAAQGRHMLRRRVITASVAVHRCARNPGTASVDDAAMRTTCVSRQAVERPRCRKLISATATGITSSAPITAAARIIFRVARRPLESVLAAPPARRSKARRISAQPTTSSKLAISGGWSPKSQIGHRKAADLVVGGQSYIRSSGERPCSNCWSCCVLRLGIDNRGPRCKSGCRHCRGDARRPLHCHTVVRRRASQLLIAIVISSSRSHAIKVSRPNAGERLL